MRISNAARRHAAELKERAERRGWPPPVTNEAGGIVQQEEGCGLCGQVMRHCDLCGEEACYCASETEGCEHGE